MKSKILELKGITHLSKNMQKNITGGNWECDLEGLEVEAITYNDLRNSGVSQSYAASAARLAGARARRLCEAAASIQ
ncbi:hypothetical protein [Aquimarina rhabdastrellae]